MNVNERKSVAKDQVIFFSTDYADSHGLFLFFNCWWCSWTTSWYTVKHTLVSNVFFHTVSPEQYQRHLAKILFLLL